LNLIFHINHLYSTVYNRLSVIHKRHIFIALFVFLMLTSYGCTPNKIKGNLTHKGRHWQHTAQPSYRPHANTNPVTPYASQNNAFHPWLPPSHVENIAKWRGIIIHHTASPSGNVATIDRIHKQKGWDGIGYDFVINNGIGNKNNGEVEVTFRWKQQTHGAHCRVNPNDDNYWNEHTIGICMVGNFEHTYPTAAQYKSLANLVKFLQKRYSIPKDKLYLHNNIGSTKCPGKHFSLWKLKSMI